MAFGIATRQAREDESASEATALVEGDDGREAFVVIGSMGNHRDACPHPNLVVQRRRPVPSAATTGWAARRLGNSLGCRSDDFMRILPSVSGGPDKGLLR